MITRLSSSLNSFKSLEFSSGLNVLLADKSEGATDLQTRNGAGKSSFVETVHFLTGGNAKTDSIFRSNALLNESFDIQMDVGGDKITAERSGSAPSKIFLNGPVEDWPIPPKFKEDRGLFEISNTNWCHTLGAKWFGLEAPPDSDTKFQPTFRSLFAYFARRQASDAFQTPTQQAGKQQIWDQQVAISYLLGLDWHVSQDFQGLREKEKLVKSLGKAARSGELGPHFGRAADLRTKVVVASRRVEQIRTQIDTFQVIPEYRELESEASDITRSINALGEENFVDRQLIKELQASLLEEEAPVTEDLEKLYAEAGVVLPELLTRRLDEVQNFHRTILQNRASHLKAELSSAENRIEKREEEKEKLDTRRQQIMTVLQSGGALEQYTALREEMGRAEAEVETLRQRLDTAETLESTKTELDADRNRLAQALRDDIRERKSVLDDAILAFEELSQSLYEQAGSLTIDAGTAGPRFEVKIDGQRSKGITNMQIFCFDLMLIELCTRRGTSPGFLIHDSHLFDGVDERQVAKALQLGAEKAESLGFQYIVTMNSDAIPSEGFQRGFNIYDHVLPTRITDAVDDGGLFGIRF
ncbi:ABC-three component system protein [Ruegeria atlantica]|uniref:ABC-three component system protein n=2 Tax=Roseobacteraceae TaxID=2854170 RepID=UPI00147B2FA5|nr:ABC-three component system protein [Ruegeria atlantica]